MQTECVDLDLDDDGIGGTEGGTFQSPSLSPGSPPATTLANLDAALGVGCNGLISTR